MEVSQLESLFTRYDLLFRKEANKVLTPLLVAKGVEVDDLLQEFKLKILKRSDNLYLDSESQLITYCCMTIKHIALDIASRKRNQLPFCSLNVFVNDSITDETVNEIEMQDKGSSDYEVSLVEIESLIENTFYPENHVVFAKLLFINGETWRDATYQLKHMNISEVSRHVFYRQLDELRGKLRG